MLCFPHAKINLGLYVTDRRPDGYHNILSCFYPIPWHDALEAVPAAEAGLRTPNLSLPPARNLVWRVWMRLQREFALPPLRWALLKGIPTEAGLGGGSSDAAFVVRMVNERFRLGLSMRQQTEILAPMTADGPFFLQDTVAVVEGIGEQVRPIALSLRGWWMVVVKPPVGIRTADAYGKIRPLPMSRKTLLDILAQPVEEWKGRLHNQFEAVAFRQYPFLRQLKDRLYQMGAAYASMTGSGTAFYGLFREKKERVGIDFPYRVFQI